MAERRRRDYDSYGVPTAAIFVGGVAAKNLAALGETRPSKALALADKLRRSGASPDTIHAETSKLLAGTPYAGVHYGRDGKPRFEVSDEGARVRKAGLDKSGRGFMGDFVEHPELYKALPEAQLLGVEKANFRGGGYDGRTIHIGDNNFAAAKLAGRPLARDSARGVALHELQHYAQDVEGFAPGASPDDFNDRLPGDVNRALRETVYRTTAGEVEAENARARRNMTAEQRRASPPSRTETVPVSEQHLGLAEGRARTGDVRRVQRMIEDDSSSAGRKPRAPRASKAVKPITDLGEKIGGARKDMAIKATPAPALDAPPDRLPRGYGVYSRGRAAGMSHEQALAQTADALAKTTDRTYSGNADGDGLKTAYEQAHTSPASHAAARTKATKPARSTASAVGVRFEYDPERVQRFKQAFPTAKFNPTTKEWSVAGVTAQKRIDKWLALDESATSKAKVAEAKARDAIAFDGSKVNHPYVTLGANGYAVRTPYDPALVKILKGLPGARWNPATKAWDVPMRSADALNAKLLDIEKIAAPMVAREQAARQQRQQQRAAQQAQWDKEKAAQKAQWAAERSQQDARMAQVRANRYLELSARNPKVGDVIRVNGQPVTVESIGKVFRADENTSSVSRLIGVEGERVNYVYHRAATPQEVGQLEAGEMAAKAAAQARKVQSDALNAIRETFRKEGQMQPKMDRLPSGRTIMQQGVNNKIYGGGEDYILKGKSLYRVLGNSADGDNWSFSNAPGSIVTKVQVTPDLLAQMRAVAGKPSKGAGLIGFQNQITLDAALDAQGKAAAGQAAPPAPPASRAVARSEFLARATATKPPGGGFEVTAPDGTKITVANAGTASAAKVAAFAKTLGNAVNKVGAVSMVAVPAAAAAYVAYQATKSQAMAAGKDGTPEAVANAALAGGTTAAVGYGAMKAIGAAMGAAVKIAPKVAPALGPVGVGLAVAGMGYGAYQGYKRHGLKGAALGSIGADMVLDAPTPGAAPAQPVQGRLSKAQQAQFATANAAYAGMQAATAKDASDGMTADYTRTVNGQTVEVRGYKTPKR